MNRVHGSPYDRGSADCYYGRLRFPHKGGVGGGSGPRIPMHMLSDQEINEYHQGYDDQEASGEKKDWR